MQYMTDIYSYQSEKYSAVTLGKFDGLHLGHQLLIDKIRSYRSENVRTVVVAFDMGRATLTTAEEKRELLKDQVDCLIVCPFTREIREMEAEDFIRTILVDKMKVSYIVVGTDFHFGRDKRGDTSMLAEYAGVYGYHLNVIDKKKYQETIISSTYVRESLEEGQIELANTLLGHPYRMSGRVEHGKQLGRMLGFPTMNVYPKPGKIMPCNGVYACDVVLDGRRYHGIGNVGVKPTVTDEKKLLAEIFVFGFEGDAYGKEIIVEFLSYERPEQKFHSVEELKERIREDIRFGKRYFGLTVRE